MENVELSHINYVGREAFSIPGLGTVVDRLKHAVWIAVGIFIVLACVTREKDS